MSDRGNEKKKEVLSRRRFLKLAGLGTAAFAAGKTGLLEKADYELNKATGGDPGMSEPYISSPVWTLVDNGPNALPGLQVTQPPQVQANILGSNRDILSTDPLLEGGDQKKVFVLDNNYDETIRPGENHNVIMITNRGDVPYFGNKVIQGEGGAAQAFRDAPKNTLVLSKEIIARYGVVDANFNKSDLVLNFSTGKGDSDQPSITITNQRGGWIRPTISSIAMIDENNNLTTVETSGLKTEAQWKDAFTRLNAQAIIPTQYNNSMTPDPFSGDIAKTPEQVLAEIKNQMNTMTNNNSNPAPSSDPVLQIDPGFYTDNINRMEAVVEAANMRDQNFALFGEQLLGHTPYVRRY